MSERATTEDTPGKPSGAPVTKTVRPAVVIDPGVTPLTGDDEYWDARSRMDSLGKWVRERLEGAGYDVGRLDGMWRIGLGGPRPCNGTLAALVGGSTPTGEAGNPFRPSRASLLARQQLRRNAAALSLAARPASGWCQKGHELTPENIYAGKSGDQCRLCRNTSYRDRRAERRALKEAA